MGYLLGVILSLTQQNGRRLGDLLAGTVVVYANKSDKRSQELMAFLKSVEVVPPPVVLSRVEQQTLLNFAERYEQLAQNRAQELAEELALAIYGEPVANAPELVLGMARYYAGDEGGVR